MVAPNQQPDIFGLASTYETMFVTAARECLKYQNDSPYSENKAFYHIFGLIRMYESLKEILPTSADHVAEKKSTCRSGRICASIRDGWTSLLGFLESG